MNLFNTKFVYTVKSAIVTTQYVQHTKIKLCSFARQTIELYTVTIY